jgi:hypothetical protein
MPRGAAFVVSEAPKNRETLTGSAELYSRTRGFLSEQGVVAIAFSYGYLVRLHMSPIDGACLNRAPRPSIWGSFFGKLSGGP